MDGSWEDHAKWKKMEKEKNYARYKADNNK